MTSELWGSHGSDYRRVFFNFVFFGGVEASALEFIHSFIHLLYLLVPELWLTLIQYWVMEGRLLISGNA